MKWQRQQQLQPISRGQLAMETTAEWPRRERYGLQKKINYILYETISVIRAFTTTTTTRIKEEGKQTKLSEIAVNRLCVREKRASYANDMRIKISASCCCNPTQNQFN